jgi:uncharacterized protein (DUF924 family)
LARGIAVAAIDAGHDRSVEPALQLFFYLPFGHSEDLADQELAVRLTARSRAHPRMPKDTGTSSAASADSHRNAHLGAQ